ncbi:hypothetical protein QS713_05850 [Gleimia hominis]|uniref:Uncharacterized protein n=1 Tax=Gleimia hominis TaxID=595468 RepID=A0ABU3IEB5_9ACTO|nr:hypothetical protein [Gleimia hominis]MDT3767585.1 hypothetical protein [Gleimia hominis]
MAKPILTGSMFTFLSPQGAPSLMRTRTPLQASSTWERAVVFLPMSLKVVRKRRSSFKWLTLHCFSAQKAFEVEQIDSRTAVPGEHLHGLGHLDQQNLLIDLAGGAGAALDVVRSDGQVQQSPTPSRVWDFAEMRIG